SPRKRFALAFVLGLVGALLIGAGALYAYDQQYVGRVLPGVAVGEVDLSGMDPAAAAALLSQAYASETEGELVLEGPRGPLSIPFEAFGRRVDVDALVAQALAVGRDGNPIERAIADVRTALRGTTLTPAITWDADALAAAVADALAPLRVEPTDANVLVTEAGAFHLVYGWNGRVADPAAPLAAAVAAAGDLDAPARIELDVPITVVEPEITTSEAIAAMEAAERVVQPITLRVRGMEEPPILRASRFRTWTTFSRTPDGGLTSTIDTSELPAVLERYAVDVDRAPVNASYTTSGGSITGVTPSRTGYRLDVAATTSRIQDMFAAREHAPRILTAIAPVLETTQPALTTQAAEAARSKMRKVSQWTTYFPVSEKNGFGANIWIPARLIDGYVVAPGATFDFWEAVGPVTRDKGYRDGGAIINGKTEPQGALAGGICSCSTTLFNAALRAGYEMGDRRNHYYYIDRYPLGLDATVFISASGSRQTMSFTNDTGYPILIRGYGWREGGSGYVKFELYSVPTGRTVNIQTGSRQNIRRASDTVQMTSSLAPGVRTRIEYPVDGFQVTAVRTVRDANGTVIHKDTYYSNYARITGIVLVGRGSVAPKPDTTADPTPTPSGG
ncbi:MAG TPA: VanW family protein, partial [Candidatus Limnocylindrales bacterium]